MNFLFDGKICGMTSLLILIFLISSGYLSIRESAANGWFNNVFIFSFLIFIYWVLIPIELRLRDMDGYFKSGSYWLVSEYSDVIIFTSIIVVFVFYFFNKYNIGRKSLSRIISFGDRERLPRNNAYSVSLKFLALILAYGFLYRQELYALGQGYSSNYLSNYSNPLMTFTKYSIVMVSAVLGVYYAKCYYFISKICLCFPFLVGLLTFDKDPIVISIVAITVAFSMGVSSS